MAETSCFKKLATTSTEHINAIPPSAHNVQPCTDSLFELMRDIFSEFEFNNSFSIGSSTDILAPTAASIET